MNGLCARGIIARVQEAKFLLRLRNLTFHSQKEFFSVKIPLEMLKKFLIKKSKHFSVSRFCSIFHQNENTGVAKHLVQILKLHAEHVNLTKFEVLADFPGVITPEI